VYMRHRQLIPLGYVRELSVGYDKLPVSPINVPPQAVYNHSKQVITTRSIQSTVQ